MFKMRKLRCLIMSILSILVLADGSRSRNFGITSNNGMSIMTPNSDENYLSDKINTTKPIEDNMQIAHAIPLDFKKSLKKFANPKAVKIIRILYEEGPMDFNRLMDRTGFSKNILNHVLYELKGEYLVVQRDKYYDITNYTVTLLEGLDNTLNLVKQIAMEELLSQRVKRDNNTYE